MSTKTNHEIPICCMSTNSNRWCKCNTPSFVISWSAECVVMSLWKTNMEWDAVRCSFRRDNSNLIWLDSVAGQRTGDDADWLTGQYRPSRGFPEYDAQSIDHALSRMMKNSWFGENTLLIVFVFGRFMLLKNMVTCWHATIWWN